MNWTRMLCALGFHRKFYLGAFVDDEGITYVECKDCGSMVRMRL